MAGPGIIGDIFSVYGGLKTATHDNAIKGNAPQADQEGNTNTAMKTALPSAPQVDQQSNTNTAIGTAGVAGVAGHDWIPDVRPYISIGTTALVMKNDKPLIEPTLYQDIIDTGKVESIDTELDTTGWMVAGGTQNKDFQTTFFYINSVMNFIGASVSFPFRLPFVDKSSTYISFINGKEKYDAFSATAGTDKPDHHVDSEINRLKVNLGLGSNYSVGYALTENKAKLDDDLIGTTVNQAISFDIHDLEKLMPDHKDTDVSIGLGLMYDFKGDWNIALDMGTFKLICSIPRSGEVSFTGYAQIGIGAF